jgi:AcrR family transcriptional regulator
MATGTRKAMLSSAIRLFRERGVGDTSFADVLEASGAPRGSVYHHFPGGKKQLVSEAIESAGGYVAANFERSEDGPAEMVDRFARFYMRELERTDFREGCPLMAAAVAGAKEEAAVPAAKAFSQIHGSLTDSLTDSGLGKKRAVSLATLAISAIEGAIVLSRTEKSVEPLDQTRQELRDIYAAALSV